MIQLITSFAIGLVLVPNVNCEVSPVNQVRQLTVPLISNSSSMHTLMRDDLYLMKWLEGNSMNVNATAKALVEHGRWRERENLDGEPNMEDSTFFKNEFVFITGHKDKMGKPIAELWITDWNVRQAIVTGLKFKLRQYVTRKVEQQQAQLYEARAKGINATHAAFLLDVENFNYYTNGCGQCINFFAMWALDWEKHYPGLYDDIILVNASPSVNLLITALKSVVRTSTINTVRQYTHKKIWLPKLDAIIDRNERSYKFGGTLKPSS